MLSIWGADGGLLMHGKGNWTYYIASKVYNMPDIEVFMWKMPLKEQMKSQTCHRGHEMKTEILHKKQASKAKV